MAAAASTVVYAGGRVHLLEGAAATCEGFVVRDGRIAAVGEAAAMRSVAGVGARHVDLAGATVIPGLVDTHPHLLHFGIFTEGAVDLADARDHADVVERIRRRAADTPAGAWIRTTPVGEPHYFIRRSWRDLAEGRLPDRRVLDRATAAHPVLLDAWAPVTPNVCALNTAGLRALGIDRETPDRVANVTIEKDAHGEPTGLLSGSVNNYYTNDPFMDGLRRKLPLPEPPAMLAGARRAMAEYNRLGVTTVYEGHAMDPALFAVYRMLREERALTVRVLAAIDAEPYGLPWSRALAMDEYAANLQTAHAMTDLRDEWLRAGGVTVSRGGPCWPGFLRMWEPYRGPYGDPTTGVTFVGAEKEAAAIEFCARTGLRLNFIGAGYRDHDEFLDRLERMLAPETVSARRWILQHVYLLTERNAHRYARFGFDVTTSMSFSWGKGDLLGERIGPHVWPDLIPLRRMLDAGLRVACGTDWGPKNVFEHLALAETHRFAGSGRENRGPAQAVGRLEALRMWTVDAAAVLGWPDVGTLRPGAHADFAVLDRDVLACPGDALPAACVLRTVVGGRMVHDAGVLAGG